MLVEFREYINQHKLFKPGEPVLLAVSGGVDSATMAWLFHKCGFNFGIAHCNFGLRGMESDGDEYLVQELAAQYDVPYYCRKFDTLTYAREQGISVQMAARNLRFSFFSELIRSQGYHCVAIAHHRDDEAETFFINLLRGTGIAGLKGYPAVAGDIIRPMLFTGRQDIESFARKHGIRYRDDSSNREDKYIRNKIRNQILPLFREINPGFDSVLSREISRIQQVEKLLTLSIEAYRKETIFQEKGIVKIIIAKLLSLPSPEACLFGFLSPYGFSGDIIRQIFESAGKQPGKTFFSRTHRLVKDREQFLITTLKADTVCERFEIANGTRQTVHPVRLSLSTGPCVPGFSLSTSQSTAYFDHGKLRFPLVLRHWKKGDSFIPFGMKGRKKLSDLFRDQKFSLHDKENCWLLCSGDDIIWVVGVRSDNRFRVTGKTKTMLTIELNS